ncbi:non-ribosomal peptide synthetase module [Marinicrinis lubricantis]|uniref:Non-ribosomal peptide synthetase module n=1 Tax=Marinicrinis lubricantis TaxID=2086470 RepID=A0ABW1ITM8_9BACL
MAKRLATHYVKTCLKLKEAELLKFVNLFADQQASLQIKVYENGNQEVAIQDIDSCEQIKLAFERREGMFISTGSCRFNNVKLANVMRKAISMFKGDALVHREYPGYIMEYEYTNGAVTKIAEKKQGLERVVYEFKNTLGKMQQQYQRLAVEAEIELLRARVNVLLDHRNEAEGSTLRIDNQLLSISKQLFALEAL